MDIIQRLKDSLAIQDAETMLQLVLNTTFTKNQLKDIYDKVIIPYIKEVDQLEDDSSKIWQEHRRSELLIMLLNGLKSRFYNDAPHQDQSSSKIILLSPEGERHDIPLRMIELSLIFEGYPVFYSGPDVPLTQIASLILEQRPASVILSVTNFYNLVAAKKTIDIIMATDPNVQVLIGGQAVEKNPEYFLEGQVILTLENLFTKLGVALWDSH